MIVGEGCRFDDDGRRAGGFPIADKFDHSNAKKEELDILMVKIDGIRQTGNRNFNYRIKIMYVAGVKVINNAVMIILDRCFKTFIGHNREFNS